MNTQPTLQQADNKLTVTAPRPAGLGNTCDCYFPNPSGGMPRLVRCRHKARRRLTLKTVADCFDVKRCYAHALELQAKVTKGATFEILNDEEL